MYKIMIDDKPLYSPILPDDDYQIAQGRIEYQLNNPGSFSFAIPVKHKEYNSIKKLKSIITVFGEDIELFRGRVIDEKKDFYNTKTVFCEGELAFLLDSIQLPYDFSGNIDKFFTMLIANHNSQVDEEKQFQIGNITVQDSNGYLARSDTQYLNTWRSIKEKLIDKYGGYIHARTGNGVRYIDYIEDYKNINEQAICFGENLLDITEYIDASDVFSVLIPLGAKDSKTSDRITVASVNNKDVSIKNDVAVSMFGKIWKTQIWDDVTLPANLLKKGMEFLDESIEMAVSIDLKAVDLSILDVDFERIKLGDYIRIISVPHGIDSYMKVSKMSVDLFDPAQSSITLGAVFTTMTDQQTNQKKNVNNYVDVQQLTAISSERMDELLR